MSSTRTERHFAKILVGVLFIGCCLISLIVPIYNHERPMLFGIPFFYWFQFLWILVTGMATAVAYQLKV